MKRYLPFVIVGLVALLSIAAGAVLYQAKRLPAPGVPKQTSLKEATEGGHILGSPDAPVTLEEFGDYECPPCGSLAAPLTQLEHDYHPRLRMIFRNFPLVNHPHARDAACAICFTKNSQPGAERPMRALCSVPMPEPSGSI